MFSEELDLANVTLDLPYNESVSEIVNTLLDNSTLADPSVNLLPNGTSSGPGSVSHVHIPYALVGKHIPRTK